MGYNLIKMSVETEVKWIRKEEGVETDLLVENLCKDCDDNCCVDFRIAMEVRFPKKYRKMLEKFPFIKVVERKLVRNGSRVEMMNVHKCERLQADGSCKNYHTKKRPQFCHNAGVKYDPTGSKGNCVLWNKLHEQNELSDVVK